MILVLLNRFGNSLEAAQSCCRYQELLDLGGDRATNMCNYLIETVEVKGVGMHQSAQNNLPET